MCMYTSSRGKINRSHNKSEFQMFLFTSGRHVAVPQRGTLTGHFAHASHFANEQGIAL